MYFQLLLHCPTVSTHLYIQVILQGQDSTPDKQTGPSLRPVILHMHALVVVFSYEYIGVLNHILAYVCACVYEEQRSVFSLMYFTNDQKWQCHLLWLSGTI